MPSPLVIGVAGGARDREVASALLRTVLDGQEPYGRAGVIGARELYDGAAWTRRPDVAAELLHLDEHLRAARERGLRYLVLELDEAAERGTRRLDLVCTVGAGGAGTARTAERGLSFSARGALADVGASRAETHYGYLQFVAHTPAWTDRLAVPLTGLFNLGPVLGAVASAALLGFDADHVFRCLLGAKAPGHGELLVSPDHRVLALVEESRSRRDAERLVAAARADYDDMTVEVIRGSRAIADAVSRAYAAADGSAQRLLVLLDDSSDALEDAFQAAVRAHARLPLA